MRWSRFREKRKRERERREETEGSMREKMRKRKTDEMTSSNGTLKRFEKKECTIFRGFDSLL